MENPFVYPLCDQTVTVYRKEVGGITRRVLGSCFYHWEQRQVESEEGYRQVTKFLLILPGNSFRLRIGDRVLDGVGPKTVDWETFLPVNVQGLGEVAYVTPWYWEGKLCHTEAGRK